MSYRSTSLSLWAAAAVVAFALNLTSCRSKSSSGGASPEAALAGAETGAESGAGNSGDAEAERAALIARTIERVAVIQDEVAALRGLPLKQRVPAAYQSQAEFRAYVERELAEDLPADKNAQVSRAVYHLGLTREPLDLARTLEDAFVSQAGAYYDPETDKFYFVMVTKNQTILDTIAAHELVHAVQDQHYDLSSFVQESGDRKLPEDQLHARRFVVEGEASLLMVIYATKSMGGVNLLDPDKHGMLRGTLEMMANISIEQAAAMQKQQAEQFEDLGDDFLKAMEAMDQIPPYILIPLVDAYGRGAVTVFEVYSAGGWDAVRALYTDPPQSTEQVLHPETKLIGARDYPVTLTLPEPAALSSALAGAMAGFDALHTEGFGELVWRAYFQTWDVADGVAAAEGWDGDAFAVYGKGEQTVSVMATTWDTDADAEQFEAAYLASLSARFSAGQAARAGAVTTHPRPTGGAVAVKRQGKDVYIADAARAGVDPTKLVAALSKTKKTKHPSDK